MGHKYPVKITKKFVSMLAASAMITTQIPSNFSVSAANADNGTKTLIGSIADPNVINVTPEKIREANDVSSTSTALPATTTTTKSAVTSTTKAVTSASSTSTTTTTREIISSATTTTTSNSNKIQPKPTLSCSKTVIPASKAGSVVPVNIFINEDNFKNESYYSYANIWLDFDGRLSINDVKSGVSDGTAGMSINYSYNTNNNYRKTYSIYASGSSNYGKNGTYATMNIKIPADAMPGDIYYFNITGNNSQKHYFSYYNSRIANGANTTACQTANTDDDPYLKGTTFDGYILIDPESAPPSPTVTRNREVVMKDLVCYNVYKDHAEVAYCDYEAENVEIASEINGQKVTSIAAYAFANTMVKSVVIPDTVNTINNYAFYNSTVESVKLPESIESISNYAFYNCRSLKELIIPSKVTSVSNYLCYNCSSLEKVTISEGVKSIGYNAFSGTAIEAVDIPDSVSSIGYSAFNGDKKLSSVKLPSALTVLPSSTFYGCTSLESIELPDTITKIEANAFSRSGLKKITYPKNLVSLGEKAFSETNIESVEYPPVTVACGGYMFHGCKKLKSVTFPDGLKNVATYAFSGCTSLEKVELPDTVTSIGQYAFSGSGVKEINIPESMTTLTNYSLAGTKLESFNMPENITGMGEGVFYNCKKLSSIDLGSKITTLPSKTFYGCTDLKEITIPENVYYIYSNVFGYTGITEVEIPDKVSSVAVDAFANSNIESIIYSDDRTNLPGCAYGGASKLKDPKLPSKLTEIPIRIFSGCSSITSFEIPASITTIDSYAFRDSYIKELKIPETVTTLRNEALSYAPFESVEFSNTFTTLPSGICTASEKLKSVKLPENLTALPNNAFSGCKALTDIEIPDSVEIINSSAFSGCYSLAELKLPSALKTIGSSAFSGCSRLTALELPEKLETIGTSAFANTSIKELKMPASIKKLENAFSSSNITDIIYPDSLTALPAYAYGSAAKMTSVHLPSKLEVLPEYCFYNCSGLTEFVIPDSIRSISQYAFQNSGVKELKVPATVDELASRAFAASGFEKAEFDEKFTELPAALFTNSKKLKTVKLASGLKVIPASTFDGCTVLESITFPDSLETIGEKAFSATGFKSIVIPESVTEIGKNAFTGSTKLTSVKLPSGLKTISDSLFYNCSVLTDVNIPDGVESIQNYAFYFCDSLTSVSLPSTLKSIGIQSFGSCRKLAELELPDKLGSINSSAFANTAITTINIPDSVNELNNAFSDSNIETIIYSDSRTELPARAYAGAAKMKTVALPSKLTAIPGFAFSGCRLLTSLEIPNTVKSIGQYAFQTSGLTEIKLPEGVETLEQYAFSGSILEKIKLPDTLTEIGTYVFSNASKLKDINFPSGVESIGDYAFNSCSSLADVKLPDGLKTIGKNAFYNCRAIKSIEIPDSVTSIGQNAFSSTSLASIKLPGKIEELGNYCMSGTQLESVEIPASVKTIGDSAFRGLKKLQSVKFNSGLETIGNNAFYGCTILSDVKLPDTLKTIGSNAFRDDIAITEIEIPASVEKIDSYAFSGTGAVSVIIPDTVKSLNTSGLFYGCTKLESAVIAVPVSTVESSCFYNCTVLKSVELPETINTIRDYAFNGCTSLTSLYIPANVVSIGSNAFRSAKLDTVIGYKETYAEKYAADKNLKFVEAETMIWNKKDSMPTVGVYKLDCDVVADEEISINGVLDLDLNGHKLTVGNIAISGTNSKVTVRDSSKGKTGQMCASGEKELFTVNGKLKLTGGTYIGNELEKDCAAIVVGNGGYFTLDGASVVSHYGSAVSFKSYNGTADLVSGTLDTASKNTKGDSSEKAAVYMDGSNYGTLNLSGATVKAGKGYGIYKGSGNGKVNITGGTVTSAENYGVYCNSGASVNLSGKLDIHGLEADIYIPGGKCIYLTDKLTGGKLRVETPKKGIITNKYAEFHKDTDPSEFFEAVKGGELSIDNSGEVFYNIPTTTTTKKTTTTTTKTTTTSTSKSATTSTQTSKTTTSTSKTNTTSATTTSSTSTTSTTTKNNIKHPKLNVSGELTFKPMTKEEIIAAGIDLNDPSNYNCVKYTIQAEFGIEKAAINKIVDNSLDGEPSGHVFFEVDGYEPVNLPDGELTWVEGLGASVMHIETVEEEMYLIIYGECKWLKEFYDVQLMIINNGEGTLTNCTSSLDIPNGLTLAKGEATQDMGELAPNEVKTTNWYLRGDKEGDYSLTASFKGENEGEPFELKFKSKDNLHVYSSKALHMTVEMPMYSYYKQDYPINITLKNVSDKPIYDLENRILGVKQGSKATMIYQDLDAEGNVVSESSVTKEKVIYERSGGPSVSIEELAPGKAITLEVKVPDLWKSVYEQYLAAEKFDEVTKMILTMVKNDPDVLGVDVIRAVYASALDEMPVEHILKNVKVGFIDSEPIPYTVVVTPAKKAQNVPARRVMTDTANTLIGDIFNRAYSEPDPSLSGFEAFRDNFICNVNITDPDEVSEAFNEYISGYDNNVWKMAEDMNLVIHPHDGQPAKVRIVTDIRQGAPSNKRADNSVTGNAFAVSEINGAKSDADGVLTVNDDTIIRISADKIGASGTLVIDYADGTTEEHRIRSVEEHECKSTGGYTLVSAPKKGQKGLAIKTCDTCGEIVDSIYIDADTVSMLSDGRTFKDVKTAVDEAVKAGEETELTIFGDAAIDSDISIPDYIKVAIARDANITVKDGGKLVANGNINDFSGYKYNLSGNGPLVTTTTTTSTTTVTTTTTSTTTTTAPVKYGDINDDGIVDAVDASAILRHYALTSTNGEGVFTKEQETAADVNKDGIADSVDASLILRYYAYCSTTADPKSIEDFLKENKTENTETVTTTSIVVPTTTTTTAIKSTE